MNPSQFGSRPTVAVVGSGPSGCYAAQAIRKTWPEAEVTIVEALPTPYGLVRYGVAPDHQGTKAVSRQFDRLFERDNVRFVGNVRVGKDVAFEELANSFDIVILATGRSQDRQLGIPISASSRLCGAGSLLRRLNGDPMARGGSLPSLGSRVAIVGNGNVAIDALRVLAKTPAELEGSDIDDEVLRAMRPEVVSQIEVVGRSGASQAKFDLSALREIGRLTDVDVQLGCTSGDENNPVVDAIRDMSREMSARTGPTRTHIVFHFGRTPTKVQCDELGRSILITTGQEPPVMGHAADSIITAIGFTDSEHDSPDSWKGEAVWRVGWLSHGARGTIPDARREAKVLVEEIVQTVGSGRISLGKPGSLALMPLVAERAVTFEQWRRLDRFEQESAPTGRCRKKVVTLDDMLRIATREPASTQ